jgi:hypothetical protein
MNNDEEFNHIFSILLKDYWMNGYKPHAPNPLQMKNLWDPILRKDGKLRFAVSIQWWKSWLAYVNFDERFEERIKQTGRII